MKTAIVLTTLRVKGPTPLEVLVEITGSQATADVQSLTQTGCVEESKRGLRLTDRGRVQADLAFASAREALGCDAINQFYDSFCVMNGRLKQAITDWQLKSSGDEPVLNDHSDIAYDRKILARIAGISQSFSELVDGSNEVGQRFVPYRTRLSLAVSHIEDGDTSFVASPLKDSFHAAWFELHEELIYLAGRSRHDEALAGRG